VRAGVDGVRVSELRAAGIEVTDPASRGSDAQVTDPEGRPLVLGGGV